MSSSLQENVRKVYDGLINACTINTAEVLEGQIKLNTILNKINEELETIRKNEYFERDREIIENLDKINVYKKRLSAVNSKMEKIQSRVDKIEKRYLKFHSEIQKIGESQKK